MGRSACANTPVSARHALGWIFVPPTVLRHGPHGMGAVQLFVDAVPEANFFTLRESTAHDFQRLCAFDYVVNNADRKGGHCLAGTTAAFGPSTTASRSTPSSSCVR